MSGSAPSTYPPQGMTRSSLKTAILSWLHRASFRTPVADPFDACNGFIAIAEQDINDSLRARCMIQRVSQIVDGQYNTLPCDYLEMFDCRNTNGPPIIYATRSATADAFWQRYVNDGPQTEAGMGVSYMPIIDPPAVPWGNGQPRRFTIVGEEIEWSPFPYVDPNASSPAPVFQVEMAYYQRLNLGMNDDDTNNVLSRYPSIYLFGALIQSAPFLRDDSRVPLWQQLYSNAVAGANLEAQRARSAGSPLRATYRRLA